MPSARWLLVTVLSICWMRTFATTADRSDQLPVASNGWRPIISTHEVKPYEPYIGEQVGPNVPTGMGNQKTTETHAAKEENKNQGQMLTNTQKHVSKNSGGHVLVNHHGSTGHRTKYNVQTKPIYKPSTIMMPIMSSTGKPMRHQVTMKYRTQPNKRLKPKPLRSQLASHSTRDEVIALAPTSGIGSYVYFNQGPLSIRDSNKQYLPQSHLDFSNHFALHNSHYPIPKPSTNELHSNSYYYFNQDDEYTRNLVPPPFVKPLDNKEPTKLDQATINDPQLIIGKQKDGAGTILPENLVIQFPPPYNGNKYEENEQKVQPNYEITKETMKEYHTTASPAPFSPSTESYSDLSKYTKSKDVVLNSHGYQVTEGKQWQGQKDESPTFKVFPTVPTNLAPQTFKNIYSTGIPEVSTQNDKFRDFDKFKAAIFLPTPYSSNGQYTADNPFPTSPTQADVSTVYSEITQMNRNKVAQQNPAKYNIKDVATHFPIFEVRRPEVHTPEPVQNEPTTQTEAPTTLQEVKPTQVIVPAQQTTTVRAQGNRNRPNQRRRRPTRPPKPTESNQEVQQEEEKPLRRRRPIKYRTSESPELNTPRTSRKPTRPPQTVTEEVFEATYQKTPVKQQKYVEETKKNDEQYANQNIQYANEELREVYRAPVEAQPEFNVHPETQTVIDPTRVIIKQKRKRLRTTQAPETTPVTEVKHAESEPEMTTLVAQNEQQTEFVDNFATEQEPTTIATTSSTTTEEPTTKSHRIRRPLNKYHTNRPRFSVKEYKERITQYISTTSTELPKASTETPKLRFPLNRFKAAADDHEDTTETIRTKFVPKDPRHRLTTTTESATDKPIRTVNTRLRPFGNQRTTTEATTTLKTVIKPKIFSTLKRPPPLSLRNRILNRKNLTTTTEVAPTEPFTAQPDATVDSKLDATPPLEPDADETVTEHVKVTRVRPAFKPNEIANGQDDDVAPDEAETFLQLQRISDLTSSAKKDYDTPGMFKNVAPISRRIPSYFTIATEDPILPIEAFFPNLSHKNK